MFADAPYRVLMSVGPYKDSYETVPDNVHLEYWYPQPSVIPQVDLFIHHGGNNSLNEALTFGKPSLVMPYCWDGHDNAQRVEELKLGARLPRYDWKPQDLLATIRRLLSDSSMKRRLKELSATTRRRQPAPAGGGADPRHRARWRPQGQVRPGRMNRFPVDRARQSAFICVPGHLAARRAWRGCDREHGGIVLRHWVQVMSALALCSAAGLAVADSPPLAVDPFRLYGNEIAFDVERDGDVVGRYVINFTRTNQGVLADARVDVDVSLLFVPVYTLRYHARELWSGGELQSIEAFTNDDGDLVHVQATRDPEGLQVQTNEEPLKRRPSFPSAIGTPRCSRAGRC